MELMLAFYPSLALLVCLVTYRSRLDWIEYGDRMYALGKRHGREESAMEVYELSWKLQGVLDDEA